MAVPASNGEAVALMPSSLWIHRGRPPQMTLPHRHDDVEVNVVLNGRLDYIFGGSQLTIHAGQVAVFWAATPHRLVDTPAGDPDGTRGCWLHIPLATVLSWGIPEPEIGRLLRMSARTAPIDCLVHDPDRLFAAWERELADPDSSSAALLEAQALLRRVLARQPSLSAAAGDTERRQKAAMTAVTRMARFIVENFREQITIADIAAAAHLNRTYAATIFSRTIGMTLGQYLTRCRVAEAQRLLITTGKTMIDITHESGFNSQSSFYEQFTRRCDVSPGSYRRSYGRPPN